MSFRFVEIYHESLPVCPRYFSQSLRAIRKLFNISRLRLTSIQNVRALVLSSYSPYPRLILTHETIKSQYTANTNLDGVGISGNNVALVKYQSSAFSDTPYLIAHELGHLLGMPHCHSRDCLMGLYSVNGKPAYAWPKLSKRRKLSKRLFCRECKAFLRYL